MERFSKFIAGIVEGRDPDLGEHHNRLSQYVVLFAEHMGYSSENILLLKIGAGIHDIGKLTISDHILNKPAKLTPSELSLVKQHPDVGLQLLRPLGLDTRISEIVHCHHENYDGSGYPRGLCGDAIPLLARVVRVLDSFDAITMDRPYHQGISPDKALQALQRNSHHYDPILLTSFIEMVGKNEIGRLPPATHIERNMGEPPSAAA